MHGLTMQNCLEIRALAKIEFQAARWAAMQYTIMAQEQHKDSDTLQPKQKINPAKRNVQQPKQCASTAGPDSARLRHTYYQHHIKAASVSDGTVIFFCSTCGAYKWRGTGKLGSVCPRHPRGPGAKQRINMLNALRFPNSTAHLSISPHRAPTSHELSTIKLKPQLQLSTTAPSWREQWNRLAKFGGAVLSRYEILSSYGQTAASLRELTGTIAEADERRIAARSRTASNQQDADSDPDHQHDQSE